MNPISTILFIASLTKLLRNKDIDASYYEEFMDKYITLLSIFMFIIAIILFIKHLREYC